MGDDHLQEYRKKRDFGKTPEPAGEVSADTLEPRFIIQKHRARRLHYDLRLEMEGVLRSWAVPKGPSYNPEDKRLAVNVEDHPLEYADFEGVIPEGEYGAGQVIVWDRGTYECVGKSKDPVEAYQKGAFDLLLKGQKLRGQWLLVKLGKEENNWLLFKKEDEFADPNSDITEEQPESVISGLRVEEMVEGEAPTWNTRLQRVLEELHAPKSEITENIRPMLATLVDRVPEGPRWVYQLKYDGIRVMAKKENGKVRLLSRNLKPLDTQFPAIQSELKGFACNQFILDGEIVAFEKDGRSSFQLLQRRINLRNQSAIQKAMQEVPAYLMVFDVVTCEDYDLRGVTWRERQKVLDALLPSSRLVRRVETLSSQGAQFLQLACDQGLEGIVAKDSDSVYQSRRSLYWQKVKCTREDLFVIGGYTRPSGSRRYFGALLLGVYEEDRLVFVGRVGTGFDEQKLEEIHSLLEPLECKQSPFEKVPAEVSGAAWVEPQLVCSVKYNEWTRDRILRAPSFQGLRPGADPRKCSFQSEPSAEPQADEEKMDLEAFPFLSNLDKVFWPEEGYTKLDLITYYYDVAPVLLPYLRNRPMNLERYPDGYAGKSFYQKDAPDFFPDWIRLVTIESDSKDKEKPNRYVVCEDRETLVYLANLACIPLHPWSSQVDNLDNPDFLILDLDPDPDIPFPQVCQFALKVRQVLEQLELVSLAKTSGSKGLHVLVPLQATYSYEMVRSFGELIARLAVHGSEQIATIERGMSKRKGKIYVDYLQNGKGKTIVSPYCVRPRPGAPVSAPLEWKEVGSLSRPEAFHIKNMMRRLEQKGDLFKPLLEQNQKLESALVKLESQLGSIDDSE